MKSKAVRTALAAAAVLFVAGGICLGAGLAMGGSPGFYYDQNGIHVKENRNAEAVENPDYVQEYTQISGVRNLDIELIDAKLEIVAGKEWAVEYVLDGRRMEPEYSLENQTLRIRENTNCKSSATGSRHYFGMGHYWWYEDRQQAQSPYVRITVPDAAKMDQVTIFCRYGDVFVERKLLAENVSIDVEDGEIRLDGWKGDSLDLDMQYGTLVAGRLEGQSVTVRNQDGTVKTGALSVETADFYLECGDLSATVEKAAGMAVECEEGAVSLNLVGGMDKFGVSLHTEWGTIRTPKGIVEPDEYDESSDFIQMEGNTAGVRVRTQYGDILVREDA